MRKIFNIPVSTLFFAAVALILGIMLWKNFPKKEHTPVYDSSSIMNKIVYIQELALVRQNYTGVISYKDKVKVLNLPVPLTDKYFLIKYNGYIKAGVDFSRVKVEVFADTVVHVSIPKPTILEASIDEKSIQVYDESENLFNPIKISDYNIAISREKSVMIQDAINQGILKQASDEARIALHSLLEPLGFREIKITEELTIPQVK